MASGTTPTQAQRCLAALTRRELFSVDKRLLAAAFSIAIGIAHPFCTELAKTAQLKLCTNSGCEWTPKRAMPFKVITLTLTSQIVAVVLAALTVVRMRGSVKVALRELLDTRYFVKVMPIGILYGLGDLLQTIACNMASAPVVLIVGQSKLFLTALLSKLLSLFFLEQTPHMGLHRWLRLLTISLAAVAAVDSPVGPVAETGDTCRGAALALLKAALSASGAIWSERVYKNYTADFWVVSFHVQSAMLLTSLILLFFGRDGPPPKPLCPCQPAPGESTCLCATKEGWDSWTWLAVAAIVLNGYATGFFLKHLSAVCKAICNLASSGVGCLACWLCQLSSCTVTQALVSCIVLLQSFDYAMEKAAESKSAGRLPTPTPCRSKREAESKVAVPDEWVSQYPVKQDAAATSETTNSCSPQ